MALRFHWMLPKSGEVAVGRAATPRSAARYRVAATADGSPAARPEMAGWIHFARAAERAGIESVLISFSRYEPDPMLVACALGRSTERLGFIIAYRSGLSGPATFVQQINTLSALVPGRVALNLVAGSSKAEQRGYGDFLSHDERYERGEEFLAVCRAFWQGSEVDFHGRHYRVEAGKLHTPFFAREGSTPEIYVSGHSEGAGRLARAQGSCWLRVAEAPETLAPVVARAREHGLDVCLRAGILCRPTREEAVRVARSLLPDGGGPRKGDPAAGAPVRDDSQMYREGESARDAWPSPILWTGLVPHHGPVWTAFVGTPRELADGFLAYQRIGVDQFILSGWPELDEVARFGDEVLPRIRRAEGGS